MRLVKITKGKTTEIAIGSRKKLMNRLKQLKSSTRKGSSGRGGQIDRVEYKVIPEEDGE
jgi:hypothetical protein